MNAYTNHKPNFIALGIVLGTVFGVSLESSALLVALVVLGIILDYRQRKVQSAPK